MYYTEGIVPRSLERQVVSYLDSNTWTTRGSRRVQSYGYLYDAASRELSHGIPITHPLTDLVDLLDVHRKIGMDLQCFVNEYRVHSDTSEHIDPVMFGNDVAVFSLLADASISFTHPVTRVSRVVAARRRSLLIFSDTYRWDYTHRVLPSGSMDLDYRRISVTFRAVRF